MSATTNGLVAKFFSTYNVTPAQCHQRARQLLGTNIVVPADVQSAKCYTVVAGTPEKYIQFRKPVSDLTETLALCKSVHGDLVPDVQRHADFKRGDTVLAVYTVQMIRSAMRYDQYCVARKLHDMTPRKLERQMNLVTGLARFFATSWKHECAPNPDANFDLLNKLIQGLLDGLPARLTPPLAKLQEKGRLLFAPGYPMVLTHFDTVAKKIFVDYKTGNLAGIAEWHNCQTLPFGFGLFCLHRLLGKLGTDMVWRYYDSRRELERVFWFNLRQEIELAGGDFEGMWETICVARGLGLYFRYGYKLNSDMKFKPQKEGGRGIAILDAFVPEGMVPEMPPKSPMVMRRRTREDRRVHRKNQIANWERMEGCTDNNGGSSKAGAVRGEGKAVARKTVSFKEEADHVDETKLVKEDDGAGVKLEGASDDDEKITAKRRARESW